MQLTFWTGLFWLVLASTIGSYLVEAAKAFNRGRRKKEALAAASDPVLERRVAELERVVAVLTDALDAQERDLARLREQQEFTERLLSARAERPDRALPKTPQD